MNKYEIMFIVKSDMEEAEIKKTAESLKSVLTSKNAKVLEEKAMGQWDLASEINKFKTGYYFLFVVEASADAIEEFNRVVGINECVLRHLVIKKED